VRLESEPMLSELSLNTVLPAAVLIVLRLDAVTVL
jgi:hypothetical protein